MLLRQACTERPPWPIGPDRLTSLALGAVLYYR